MDDRLSTETDDRKLRDRLQALFEAVNGARRVLIIPHNDPDPDAIGSAFALRHLLADRLDLQSDIVYQGLIGRAENKALVRYLGHPLRRLKPSDLQQGLPVALIDTQPGTGNNPLTSDGDVAIIFDHHPRRGTAAKIPFVEIRSDVGATSTILTEYLQAAVIKPPTSLATALFYGIKTDTQGLAREASPADVAAYMYLQSRIDVRALSMIENAQLPAEYFRWLSTTLHAARIYERVIIAFLGEMDRPDLAAEMADLLLRLEGIVWVICMGVHKGTLILAVRTRDRRGGAERLVVHVVEDQGTAGGHGTMAGGQVPLLGHDPARVAHKLAQKALEHLHVTSSDEGLPLI